MTRAFSSLFAACFTGLWLLAALSWWWLSIAERRWWDVAATALLGALIVALALCLVTAAFAWGALERRWLRSAARVLPFCAGAAAMIAWQPSWWTVVTLGLVVPPLLHWACGGRGWVETVSRPGYWLAAAVWLAAGVYLPWRLLWWIPALQGLTAQAASAALRFLAASLLFSGVTAWFTSQLWKEYAPAAEG